jgi:hypothetical protein
MALTPNIQASQGFITSVTDGPTPNTNVSQAFVAAVANFPTPEIDASQAFVSAVTSGPTPSLSVSQSYITVVCKGRVDDPKVRVWTYTLDGSDYYVVRLGNIETLVYSTSSGQWSVYGSFEGNLWKAFTGINWQGGTSLSPYYGSNIIVGDDANGALYFLNPDKYLDDDPIRGSDSERTFERVFQGQIPARGYGSEKCYSVELSGSIGDMDEPTLTSVTLSYSDDSGQTYVDAGTVDVTNADYGARVNWRSLGSFSQPGRLFKITDTGALHRVDYLSVETNKE